MAQIDPKQFVLELVPGGGILLDLASGVLSQLNRTAAFVWERALAGSGNDDISRDLVRTFEVLPEVARDDVARTLSLPAGPALRQDIPDFGYELVNDRYRFSKRGVGVLEIAASGEALRVVGDVSPKDLRLSLRAVSPKLVSLLGSCVLHASAILRSDQRAMAFLGESGAGKTTTARTFSQPNMPLLCEDKLVLRFEGGQPGVVVNGEARIESWLDDLRSRIGDAGPNAWLDVTSLRQVADGAVAPLAEVLVIDRFRRFGESIVLERLAPAVAATEIFRHGFYGSAASTEWRFRTHAAATIGRSTRVFSATMPDGVDRLAWGARRYMETVAS